MPSGLQPSHNSMWPLRSSAGRPPAVLGHSFLSRNIPLRFIYSLVRMRAGKEKEARAPHRNFGHMLASLARRLHTNVICNCGKLNCLGAGHPWPADLKLRHDKNNFPAST